VDGVPFDDAVAGGWGLADDGANGGDRVGYGFGEGWHCCAWWGLWR